MDAKTSVDHLLTLIDSQDFLAVHAATLKLGIAAGNRQLTGMHDLSALLEADKGLAALNSEKARDHPVTLMLQYQIFDELTVAFYRKGERHDPNFRKGERYDPNVEPLQDSMDLNSLRPESLWLVVNMALSAYQAAVDNSIKFTDLVERPVVWAYLPTDLSPGGSYWRLMNFHQTEIQKEVKARKEDLYDLLPDLQENL